ncbi:hypothetical protein GCM10009654_43700 [Streptomyces hebeiensis]|uniref:Uncharacterized protein n=1 Tax=Streptomyces hebeiensis TaxID=229486 RepID=A0ABN1V0X1_9ACTN
MESDSGFSSILTGGADTHGDTERRSTHATARTTGRLTMRHAPPSPGSTVHTGRMRQQHSFVFTYGTGPSGCHGRAA